MNFTAVPPGTPAAAALALRGGDPDLEFPTAHAYERALGVAHGTRNAAAANTKAACWSEAAGAILPFLVTRDPLVLAQDMCRSLLGPGRIDAAYLHYLNLPQFANPQNMTPSASSPSRLRSTRCCSAPPHGR